MAQKKKNYYVDNKQFYEEIVKYRNKCKEYEEQGKQLPRIPEYIGDALYKIAIKLTYHPRFLNYTQMYKEEMVSYALENCLLYFDRYDPVKGQNPFAYFTQVIWFAFFRKIREEEVERYTKYKYFQENFVNTGTDSLLLDRDDKQLISFEMYDNINDFMASFEEREKEKKLKRLEKKKES